MLTDHRPVRTSRLTRESRLALLEPLLARRILVLDGAMGTMIQTYGLGEREYRGERFADWPRELRGHSDLLTLTQPGIIRAIHSAYLEAGADIVETNSFTSNAMSLADYGMEEHGLRAEPRRRAGWRGTRPTNGSAATPTRPGSWPACSARPTGAPRSRPT